MELYHVQHIMSYTTEDTLDILTFHTSETIVTVLFVDAILEIESKSANYNSFQRAPSIPRSWTTSASHCFFVAFQPYPFWKNLTLSSSPLTILQSPKTNWKTKCTPLKRQMQKLKQSRFIMCIVILKTKLNQFHLEHLKSISCWIALHLFLYLIYD